MSHLQHANVWDMQRRHAMRPQKVEQRRSANPEWRNRGSGEVMIPRSVLYGRFAHGPGVTLEGEKPAERSSGQQGEEEMSDVS